MSEGSIDVFPLPRGAASGLGTVGGWWISSYAGGRPDPFTGRPSTHGAIDIPAPTGTPLYAVKPGRIYQSWDPGGGGWWTRLETDDGETFGYGHANKFAPGANGRRVEAGELIAYVGSTGRSTGPHLHFQWRPEGAGSNGDPLDMLTACRTFVGSPAPKPDPIPTEPKPSHTPPAPIEETPPMETVKFAHDARMWLHGYDRQGEFFHDLTPDNDPKITGKLPQRLLGAGDDDLDRRFKAATGI